MNNHEYETEVYDAWYAALAADDFDKALQIAAREYVRATEEKSADSAMLFRKFIRLAAGEAGCRSHDGEPAALAVCSLGLDRVDFNPA